MNSHVYPRRPYDDEKPNGYMESDTDFVLNNIHAAVELLERELKIMGKKTFDSFVCGHSPSDRTYGTQVETLPSKAEFDKACARFEEYGPSRLV